MYTIWLCNRVINFYMNFFFLIQRTFSKNHSVFITTVNITLNYSLLCLDIAMNVALILLTYSLFHEIYSYIKITFHFFIDNFTWDFTWLQSTTKSSIYIYYTKNPLYSMGYFQTSLVGSSPFRERLGSNRLPEKPRPRFEQFSSASTTCRTKVFSLISRFPSRS